MAWNKVELTFIKYPTHWPRHSSAMQFKFGGLCLGIIQKIVQIPVPIFLFVFAYLFTP